MATKTQDPDYSAEKQNNFAEINISRRRYGVVNKAPSFVSSI